HARGFGDFELRLVSGAPCAAPIPAAQTCRGGARADRADSDRTRSGFVVPGPAHRGAHAASCGWAVAGAAHAPLLVTPRPTSIESSARVAPPALFKPCSRWAPGDANVLVATHKAAPGYPGAAGQRALPAHARHSVEVLRTLSRPCQRR